MTPGVEVLDVAVTFGGLRALGGVSIAAPVGRVTGLIGPNGAGKTTMFNAITGLNRPDAGTISLFGDDVSTLAPQARARMGLGRTFQRMELCETLSVRDNVAVGREAGLAASNPMRHLFSARSERDLVAGSVDRALADCGIMALGDRRVAELSTGQRRLVELARALAGPYRMLLLDEPSSGLDRTETARFGAILEKAVHDRELGILLVEHDMSLVMGVCERVYVLDFGRLVFEGTADEARRSDEVRAAYLGTDAA